MPKIEDPTFMKQHSLSKDTMGLDLRQSIKNSKNRGSNIEKLESAKQGIAV